MLPEFRTPKSPETPRFWADLETELRQAAQIQVRPPDIPSTPRFERALLAQADSATAGYREPRFPAIAAAAIASMVLVTALLLQALPGLPASSGIAAPGVAPRLDPVTIAGVTEAPDVNAQAMVVASFARFADDRTEVDRLAAQLRNQGYEVSVSHRVVPDPSLDGQILEMRHAYDTTGATITTGEARGPVVLVVAIAAEERPVS